MDVNKAQVFINMHSKLAQGLVFVQLVNGDTLLVLLIALQNVAPVVVILLMEIAMNAAQGAGDNFVSFPAI